MNIAITLPLHETREITESCSDPFDGLGVEVDDAKHDETLKAVDDVTDHRKLRKGRKNEASATFGRKHIRLKGILVDIDSIKKRLVDQMKRTQSSRPNIISANCLLANCLFHKCLLAKCL
jgi:hypothetical protein